MLNWKHIVTAMNHRFDPKISKTLADIIDGECNVSLNDFSKKTIKYIVTQIGEECKLNKDQLQFMDGFIQKAKRFDPITQCDIDEVASDIRLDDGILCFLGTDPNTQKWRNPAIIGKVNVSSNVGLASTSQPLSSIVGRECRRFCTQNKKNSWIMIDLLHVKIKPTHYSIQHYITNSKYCLRNWCLEGYHNSDGWRELSVHYNDTTLHKAADIHKWSISKAITNDDILYSRFRIHQFDVNSSNTHHLALSLFEIYGIAVFDDYNKDNKYKKTFVYKADNDNGDLLHYLGESGDITKQISVSSSPLHAKSDDLSYFVNIDRINCSCYTEASRREAYIILNLKQNQIKLTKYTLKNNANNRNILRNWNLEGSVDGIEWVILRKHINDESLNKPNEIQSWDIDCSQYFSQFRIIMTAVNNKGNWSLSCSGIELYGTAIIHNTRLTKTDIFMYESHYDKNGILYYLGTDGDITNPYTNPTRTDSVSLSSSPRVQEFQQFRILANS